tara:strand:- start:147 stop:737 length:591 start_codon:yes stop_codon:yes gene_type:complete
MDKSIYCGAKNNRGGSCRHKVIEKGSRCRFHGGKSTGPKTAKGKAKVGQNATRHGIYSRHYTDEEVEVAATQVGRLMDLSEEILTAQIELYRIEKLMATRRDDPRAGIELTGIESGSKEGGREHSRQTFALPDLRRLKDTFLARIARLKRTHKDLISDQSEMNVTIHTKDYRDAVLERINKLRNGHSKRDSEELDG